jgi:uncharacterized membrane protein YqhA
MNLVLRITIFIICIVTFLNALVFTAVAVIHSFTGYHKLFIGDLEDRPGINLVESLDGFLLAIVFIIFSVGFGKLFLPENKVFQKIDLDWLRPKSFADLKVILWQAILTTLVVLFAVHVVEHMNHLTPNMLILPGSVLLISLALKFMHGKE